MKLYIPLLIFVGASYLVHGQAPVKPKAVAHQHRPAMFKYDLEEDIDETNNLADKYPSQAAPACSKESRWEYAQNHRRDRQHVGSEVRRAVEEMEARDSHRIPG